MFKKLQSSLQDCGSVLYKHPCFPDKDLNSLLGKNICISIQPTMPICLGCQSPQKKIIQGYCYRCSIKLACCDLCMLKPELCHFDRGTCRQPEWGLEHCFQPHVLYIALSSSLKIGLSRSPLSRWVDQGASRASVLLTLSSRREAGLIERALIEQFDWNDKTNWRDLVKGVVSDAGSAETKRIELLQELPQLCALLKIKPISFGAASDSWQKIIYPVKSYVQKPISWNLLRDGGFEAELTGICGQYLLFAGCNRVVNMKNYSGYAVSIEERG